MAEEISVLTGTKEEQYQNLFPQIEALVAGETDLIANMANICGALMEQFHWFWIGFYIVKDNELVVGPFQGPVACTRIRKGRGVCGTAWEKEETVIVEDVNQFSGHIACNSKSKSEIVIPLIRKGEVVAVLDIDNDEFGSFDETDAEFLKKVTDLLVL